MRRYLLVTGIIFALFALGHVVELVLEWNSHSDDIAWIAGVAAVIAVSGALANWAFRLRHRFNSEH